MEKLTDYCLNLDHEIGAPKAEGFSQILGITSADVEYLADALQMNLLRAPVGTWPTGTVGAVVGVYENVLLMEITGPGGRTVDTVQVSAGQLELKRHS